MHTLWLLARHICAHLPSQQRVVSKGHDDCGAAGHRPQQHQNEKGEDAELAVSLPCGPYVLDAFCGCLARMYGQKPARLVIPMTDGLFPQICVRCMPTTS